MHGTEEELLTISMTVASMELLILAGQSNMAGRGDLEHLHPRYSAENDDGKHSNTIMHNVNLDLPHIAKC